MARTRQGGHRKPRRSRGLTIVRLAKVVELLLVEHGLTVNQYRMLTFIDEGTPPLAELGTRLVMKLPNITTLIDGLVTRGLVSRARHAHDRRRVALGLSARGRRLLARAQRRCEAGLEVLAAKGPGDPAQRLLGLDRWLSALDAVAAEVRARRRRPPGMDDRGR
jgi:DNA-binding MarR family transcriptional regulator